MCIQQQDNRVRVEDRDFRGVRAGTAVNRVELNTPNPLLSLANQYVSSRPLL